MNSDWMQAQLSSVASLCLGKMLDKAKNRGTLKPYLRNANVRWGEFDLSDVQQMAFEEHEEARYTLVRGDIVMCEGGEPGRCAVWTRADRFYIQKALHRIRCGPNLDPKFLSYQFRLLAADGTLSRSFTGSTIKHLPGDKLAEVQIRFPTLPEQHRIVAEIEKHFTRLDDAVATLERVQASLKQARASVLKAAVEGRLVPTEAELARAEGRTYEPASVLLERILEERRRKHEERNGKKKYKAPVGPEMEELPDLPEGWAWASVDQLAWSSGYGTSVKCDQTAAGPPVLRIPNIQRGDIDLQDLKFATDPAVLRPEGSVEPGDLLFVRTNGSLNLIGLGATVIKPLSRKSWFASYLIRLRLCGGHEVWRWFGLLWNSRVIRRYVERDAASSAGQFNVSLSAALAYQIPMPPIAEQCRIVAEAERRLSVLDALEQTLQLNLARCAHLRQSILKRAFSGKLVPQDPNDEPASALLARIQASAAP